ncbi:MAG: TatD family hydrolase [Chloroflexi bacterium]|nr:TatD family hydrolase [Chloroflexota bacterium]
MLFDTHVHLSSFPPGEREKQIDHARRLGTKVFVEMASNGENAERAVRFAESQRDFYSGVACHPNSVEKYDAARDLPIFKRHIKESKKIVCVGECGLDYENATPQRGENQRKLFRDMIRLARESNLPLNMHTDRLSVKDMITVLREEKAYEVGGMIHNFGGNLELARQFLDLGFYISVCVRIHHPLDDRLRGVYRDISIGQMVMDSDAPGAKLIRVGDSKEPYPYDLDTKSEPHFLRYICDKLAELKGLPVETVEAVTTLNAKRLFGLAKLPA